MQSVILMKGVYNSRIAWWLQAVEIDFLVSGCVVWRIDQVELENQREMQYYEGIRWLRKKMECQNDTDT